MSSLLRNQEETVASARAKQSTGVNVVGEPKLKEDVRGANFLQEQLLQQQNKGKSKKGGEQNKQLVSFSSLLVQHRLVNESLLSQQQQLRENKPRRICFIVTPNMTMSTLWSIRMKKQRGKCCSSLSRGSFVCI